MITLRQALNIAYSMHVKSMDAEQLAEFEWVLNSSLDGSDARRESIARRAASLGSPVAVGV